VLGLKASTILEQLSVSQPIVLRKNRQRDAVHDRAGTAADICCVSVLAAAGGACEITNAMVSEDMPKIAALAKLGIFMVRLLFLPNASLGFRDLLSPRSASHGIALCGASLANATSTNVYIK